MQPARRPKGGLAAVPWTTLTEFRGETGLADSWPTNGPPLVWEKQIGTGYSAPSVRSNWLILHHRLGDEEIVEAFEPATGKPAYGVTPTPADSLILTGSITVPAARRCSPKISVTLSAPKGNWCAWSCARANWSGSETPPPIGTCRKPFSASAVRRFLRRPVDRDGRGPTQFGHGRVRCAHRKDALGIGREKNWEGQPMIGWPGERTVKWQNWEKQASYATPVAATIHGQRHILCFMRQGLVSVNPTNGAVNFSFGSGRK